MALNKFFLPITVLIGVIIVLPKILGKTQPSMYASPNKGEPGTPFVLSLRNFDSTEGILLIVQGHSGNGDAEYFLNVDLDGNADYNFVVEVNRPPGNYIVTAFDGKKTVSITFEVL